jgi:hypothetical protein
VAKDFLPKPKEKGMVNCEFVISGSKEYVIECLELILRNSNV